MSVVKNFWFYAVLLIAIVLVVLGYMYFWGATDSTKNSPPTDASPPLASKATDVKSSTPSSNPVPNDFSTPAKKLHQVINDVNTDDPELDQKLETLDQQLSVLKQQLEAHLALTAVSYSASAQQTVVGTIPAEFNVWWCS